MSQRTPAPLVRLSLAQIDNLASLVDIYTYQLSFIIKVKHDTW